MEKLGLDIDVGSSPGDMKQLNPQEARKSSIQRCIQSLVHACQCRDANCQPSCQKMKRVVTHSKICKRKTKGDCLICKQLIALCCHHGRHCQETECSVPFCSSIKQKLKQQQVQQRVQQAKLLRRRMAAMNTRAGGGNNVQETLQQQQQLAGAPVQHGSQPMHQKALQQLRDTLRAPNTHDQQQEILQILKSNPPLMAAFIKQRQQAIGVGLCGVCGMGRGRGMPQMQHMMQPRQMHQMLPRQSQQQQLAGLPVQQDSQPMIQIALQKLMATLRSPITHNQQQKILQILKSNPPLMAAFIKQRKQAREVGLCGVCGASRGSGMPQMQHMMHPQHMHQRLPRRSQL